MQKLTSANIPDGELTQRLGLVLDNELMTAPVIQCTITNVGQSTGTFDQKEVDFIAAVLRAGELPKELHAEPVKEIRLDK